MDLKVISNLAEDGRTELTEHGCEYVCGEVGYRDANPVSTRTNKE